MRCPRKREGWREGGKERGLVINGEGFEGSYRYGGRGGGREGYTQTYRRVRHGIQPQLLRQRLVRRAHHPKLLHLLLAQALPSLPPSLQDMDGHVGVEFCELGCGGFVPWLAEFLFGEVELGGEVEGGGGGGVEEGD